MASTPGLDAHDADDLTAQVENHNLPDQGYQFLAEYIDQYSDADLAASYPALTYSQATADVDATTSDGTPSPISIVSIFETTDMSSTDAGTYTWEDYLIGTQSTTPSGQVLTTPESQGTYDAQEAYASALKLGQPSGSTIYFAMDFDPAVNDLTAPTAENPYGTHETPFTQYGSGAAVEARLKAYFQAVDAYFTQQAEDGGRVYNVGVYGADATLEYLSNPADTGTATPLVTATWRTGSTGWAGTLPAAGDTTSDFGGNSDSESSAEGVPWTLVQVIPGVSQNPDAQTDTTDYPQYVDGVEVDEDINQTAAYGGWDVQDPPCYATGTRILTERGEVPVEALRVGDRVVALHSGGLLPVRWIGHRRIDLCSHPRPAAVRPVRVAAGAFGEGRPHRPLWLSPGHSVYVDGVLIQIEKLINGATIVQMPQDEITYWHVELPRHDLLLAEGLAAESYLDTGNRSGFVNGGGFLELHPDFAPRHWSDTCVPLVQEGPRLAAVKAGLLQRAIAAFGYRTTADCGLRLLADGQVIAPRPEGAMQHFAVPPGANDIRLVSRVWVPSELDPQSGDRRRLGVCVCRMMLDGTPVALDGGLPAGGWHAPESSADGTWRWTDGAAHLPRGVESVAVELGGARVYWAAETSAGPSAEAASAIAAAERQAA